MGSERIKHRFKESMEVKNEAHIHGIVSVFSYTAFCDYPVWGPFPIK
jgi:hypothetical protein